MRHLADIVYSRRDGLRTDVLLPGAPRAAVVVLPAPGGGSPDADAALSRVVRALAAGGAASAVIEWRAGADAGELSREDREVAARLAERARGVGLGRAAGMLGPGFYAGLLDASLAVQFLWVKGAALGLDRLPVGVLGFELGGAVAAALAYPPNHFEARLVPVAAAAAVDGPVLHPWRLGGPGTPLLLLRGTGADPAHDRFIRRAEARGLPVELMDVEAGAEGLSGLLSRDSREGQAARARLVDHLCPLQRKG